jgi:hypothetical protein
MDEAKLKQFIFEAGKKTYAANDASVKVKQADGSTTIEYSSGPFRLHDNYFGGEPYGGREVVFLNDKAVWMMVYYGWVNQGVAHNEVYKILMEALMNAPEDSPYRGPTSFESGNWRYENNLLGNLGNFSGTEKIFKDDVCVYEASYLGGWTDQ